MSQINPIPRCFNVKSTNLVLTLAEQPLASVVVRWGLISSWFKEDEHKGRRAITLNARIEAAKDKPAYRAACRYGWCPRANGI